MIRLSCDDDSVGPSLLPGNLVITLPCGHRSMVRRVTLNALTAQDCSCYSCSVCGERALQPADDNELILENLVRRSRAFIGRYGVWVNLDRDIEEEGDPINLPTASAMMCAISGALASFTLPALISPPDLSFIAMQETKIVFAEVEKSFGDGLWAVSSTPKQLHNDLLHLVQKALSASMESSGELDEAALPPGWNANTRRWFTLAVRLVSGRQCAIQETQHAGLHLHDSGLFCGILDIDEYARMEDNGMGDDDGRVTSMDELSKLMNGTSLFE